MIGAGLATLLLAAVSVDARPPEPPPRLAGLSIRQRMILRIPTRPPAAPQAPIKWSEKKASRCVTIGGLAGAAMMRANTVDLILVGGRRFRVEFEGRCTAIDFYSGFYLKPTEDQRLCARRDSIHLRSGGECQIRRFRRLVADR